MGGREKRILELLNQQAGIKAFTPLKEVIHRIQGKDVYKRQVCDCSAIWQQCQISGCIKAHSKAAIDDILLDFKASICDSRRCV